MPDVRPGDFVKVTVESVTRAEGRAVARLRLRHERFRPDRAWSYCDVVVAPPAGAPLRAGDELFVVLEAAAEASRLADAPGGYSCRVHAADEAPSIPIERSSERVWGGLIERSAPPAGGAIVLHLGSGLTCYLTAVGEGPYPAESLEHGSWSEFILEEPLRVASLERRAR